MNESNAVPATGVIEDEEVIGDYRYKLRKLSNGDVQVSRILIGTSEEEDVTFFGNLPSEIRRRRQELRNLASA